MDKIQGSVSELLPQAWEHFQARRWREAYGLYAIDPANADITHLLGVVALKQGNVANAVQIIQKALQLRTNSADFLNNLCEAYRLLGRPSEAAQC
jgi:Flp pilus assembly protein TadD